jgi:hypothetical protein
MHYLWSNNLTLCFNSTSYELLICRVSNASKTIIYRNIVITIIIRGNHSNNDDILLSFRLSIEIQKVKN